MGEDIKILEDLIFEMKTMGLTKRTLEYAHSLENLIKGYRELEEKHKKLFDKYNDRVEEIINLENNSIPKSKIKEIFDRLNISDIEPWSTYKVNGQILFDLQELMEDK